jgi:hypothetical protein
MNVCEQGSVQTYVTDDFIVLPISGEEMAGQFPGCDPQGAYLVESLQPRTVGHPQRPALE